MSLMPQIIRKGLIRDSYSIQPVTGFMRSEMEVGPARQRKIASAMPTNVSFKLLLNREALAVLEAWYKHTLQNGSAWFSMPVDSGKGFVYTDTRFTAAYSVSAAAFNLYEIECQAECRELPVLSNGELEAYLDGSTEESDAFDGSVIDLGYVTERVDGVIDLG